MKKGFVISIVIILIILIGFLIFNLQGDKGTSSRETTSNFPAPGNENIEEMIVGEEANVIGISSSGFSPQTLTINQGDSVTFVNKDSQAHWPATAVHPTHTVYPGSDIKKCNTAEQSMIFDACKGLAQGEEWSFTFNEKGTWQYHDHLTGLRGTIVVN